MPDRKERQNVYVDGDLLNQAKSLGVNISQAAEYGIRYMVGKQQAMLSAGEQYDKAHQHP